MSILTAVLCIGAAGPATAAGPTGPRFVGEWPDGRSFRAVGLIDHGAPRPIVSGTTIRLSFGADNHLTVRAGCNIMFGRGRIIAHRLIVRSLASTRMACAPARMAQDRWVSTLLTGRPHLTLTDHRLILRSGRTQMRLVQIP